MLHADGALAHHARRALRQRVHGGKQVEHECSARVERALGRLWHHLKQRRVRCEKGRQLARRPVDRALARLVVPRRLGLQVARSELGELHQLRLESTHALERAYGASKGSEQVHGEPEARGRFGAAAGRAGRLA